MTLARSERRWPYLLLAPLVVYMLVMTIFPLVYNIWLSLTNYSMGTPHPGRFVGLSNYGAVLQDHILMAGLYKALLIAVIAIPVQSVLGFLFAKSFLGLGDRRGAGVLRSMYLVPVMVTSLVVGLYAGYMLDPNVGVVDGVLQSLGLAPSLFLTSPQTSMPTLIGAYLWQWTPFSTMLILGGLVALPPEILEAAAVDGAHDGLVRWLNIDVPLLRSVFAINALLSLVQISRMFGLVYGATRGGPGTTTMVIGMGLFRDAFEFFNTGYSAAAAMILLVIVVLISQVFVRYTPVAEGDR